MDRLTLFLVLFTFVYFLESIGGSYMISAVQNIERQFQIPSKLSGFLVSAHDISYVPTVIFISYFGSRGNRAKWIGAGTILIAFAHIFTATPNFFFPVTMPNLNLTQIKERSTPDANLLSDNATISSFFEYAPIRDRIPVKLRALLLHRLQTSEESAAIKFPLNESQKIVELQNHSRSLYSIDEPLISQILFYTDAVIRDEEESAKLLELLQQFVKNRQMYTDSDLGIIRRAAIAPFAFCHQLVNDLRQILENIQCHEESSNFGPLMIIFLALLTLGVGRTMPWTLGIPLIDDNVKSKSMPVYFAMISFIRIMGPICGFLIGSAVNKLYYTFPAKSPRGLTPQDPTWIGAWWLGFLIIGILTVIPSVALFFFPESSGKRKVADANAIAITNGNTKKPLRKGSEKIKLSLFDRHVKKNEAEEEGMLAGEKVKRFLMSYRDILRSKIYTGTVVGRVMDVMAFKGYMVFLPKYLENHYGIPKYRVHLYMALFGVLGFACGTACGGIITRRFRMNGRQAAMFVFVISLVNTLIFFSKSFLGCHSIVNGIGKIGEETDFNYTRSCNAECGCGSAKLFPVCDQSGHVFYSPCHAGCRHVHVVNLESYDLEFSECDCVPGGVVRKEYCQDNCKFMTNLFFVTVVTGAFVAGTGVVPGMLILLRSVPPQTRSPALGLQGFLVSLLGTLPSPILWGAVIDSACLMWENTCSSQGTCQIYDPTKLRVRMHVLYVLIRTISILTDLYVFYHAKDLNIQDDEKSEKKNGEEERCEAEREANKENIALDVL